MTHHADFERCETNDNRMYILTFQIYSCDGRRQIAMDGIE